MSTNWTNFNVMEEALGGTWRKSHGPGPTPVKWLAGAPNRSTLTQSKTIVTLTHQFLSETFSQIQPLLFWTLMPTPL